MKPVSFFFFFFSPSHTRALMAESRNKKRSKQLCNTSKWFIYSWILLFVLRPLKRGLWCLSMYIKACWTSRGPPKLLAQLRWLPASQPANPLGFVRAQNKDFPIIDDQRGIQSDILTLMDSIKGWKWLLAGWRRRGKAFTLTLCHLLRVRSSRACALLCLTASHFSI